MPSVTTPFGTISILPTDDFFESGTVRSCIAAKPSPLQTPYGEVLPQYTANTLRQRQLPDISFHKNGMIRTLPLEEQVEAATPLGPMPAEQISFYKDGALKRVFPLNGRLSGFWSQEDEAQLAVPLELDTPAGRLRAIFISIYFGPHGELRSLTMWPGEKLDVPCPCGVVPVRCGVSFHDSGEISSVEPAKPTAVDTPLGVLTAFDPDAIGVTGDANSLRFAKDGRILGLTTTNHEFVVLSSDSHPKRIAAPMRRSHCDGETLEPTPLLIEFNGDLVTFSADGMDTAMAHLSAVRIAPRTPSIPRMEDACSMRTAW